MSLSKLADLEKLAEDARIQMGAKTIDDLVDPLLIELEDVKVISLNDISEVSKKTYKYLIEEAGSEWSAMSVPLDLSFEKWVILINHTHDIERQRASILEEFWHIIQGHSLVRIIQMGNSHGRSYHPDEEDEAFYLASATLLPKLSVEKFVFDINRNLDLFAKKYGVSQQLVEFRIKRLGLWYHYKPKKISFIKPK